MDDYSSDCSDNQFFIVNTTGTGQLLLAARTRTEPPSETEENGSSVCHEPSPLWRSSKRPTQRDHEATLLLLALRREFDNDFTNKTKVKLDLWMQIANKLNEMGFFVGYGVEGRDRCKTKFHNLQAMYMKTVDARKRTGEGKIKLPPYFEELDAIFHDKHKARPVYTIDSTTPNTIASTSASTTSSCSEGSNDTSTSASFPETSDSSSGRFNKIKKSVKPSSKTEALQELIQLQKNAQTQRQEEFRTIIELVNKQSEQRHEQIMALLKTSSEKTHKKKKKLETYSSESD